MTHISPVDEMADHFKRITQRLDSLERAVNSGSGYRSGTYTPPLTNVVVGTGGLAANTAYWNFDGLFLTVSGYFTLGQSGASLTGIPRFTFPAGFTHFASTGTPGGINTAPFGQATFYEDQGLTWVSRMCKGSVAGTVAALYYSISGGNILLANPSATAPFTWGANDSIHYEYSIPGSFA